MPLAFLAMCSFSMSWYSARHAVLSSKFVEPAYVKFIVAVFAVQSSSILYPLAPDVGLTIVCRCGFVASGPSMVVGCRLESVVVGLVLVSKDAFL